MTMPAVRRDLRAGVADGGPALDPSNHQLAAGAVAGLVAWRTVVATAGRAARGPEPKPM